MGLLADAFSYGNGLKRKVNGLLADPVGTLELGVNRLGEDQNKLLGLLKDVIPAGRYVAPEVRKNALKELADYGSQLGMAGVVGYHGTMTPNFDKFNLENFGRTDSGWLGKGIYAAKSPTDASAYATVGGKPGGAVFKVDMPLDNPLHLDWDAPNRAEIFAKRRELGPDGFTAWLQSLGHDGVIFQGPKNALNAAGERDIQYMAIDPQKVKQINY